MLVPIRTRCHPRGSPLWIDVPSNGAVSFTPGRGLSPAIRFTAAPQDFAEAPAARLALLESRRIGMFALATAPFFARVTTADAYHRASGTRDRSVTPSVFATTLRIHVGRTFTSKDIIVTGCTVPDTVADPAHVAGAGNVGAHVNAPRA